MRTRYTFLSNIFTAFMVSMALSSPTMAAAVSLMTAEELKALQQTQIPVIVISVGSREIFDRWHIEGAIHLSLDEIKKVAFPLETKIVLYTSGFGSQRLREAGAALVAKGYQNVSRLQGGLESWKSAGIPLSRQLINDPVAQLRLSTITARHLMQAIQDQDDFVLVDVRSPDVFQNGHAQGAINASIRDLDATSASWAKSKWVVVYDDGRGLAQAALSTLYRLGFIAVGYVRGGYPAVVAETPQTP